MDISIRQAGPGDADTVSSILVEAASWLVERGTPMWRADELSGDRIGNDVNAGLFFLAEADETAAGAIKFQLSDPVFWPDMRGDDSAYVHRLAVRRSFAGGTASATLLSWAVQRTATLGRPFLRLDCEASRAKLRTLYERLGFKHHSNRQVGPYAVARYQLAIKAVPT